MTTLFPIKPLQKTPDMALLTQCLRAILLEGEGLPRVGEIT